MDAYSLDLRSRVWEALAQREGSGESIQDIADRFSVSRQWIYLLMQRMREDQTLCPKPHGGGQPRKVSAEIEEKLKQEIQAKPDATLAEIRDRLGIVGSLMCIWRALKRLKITRKKRRYEPRNKMTQR